MKNVAKQILLFKQRHKRSNITCKGNLECLTNITNIGHLGFQVLSLGPGPECLGLECKVPEFYVLILPFLLGFYPSLAMWLLIITSIDFVSGRKFVWFGTLPLLLLVLGEKVYFSHVLKTIFRNLLDKQCLTVWPHRKTLLVKHFLFDTICKHFTSLTKQSQAMICDVAKRSTITCTLGMYRGWFA